MILQLEIQDTKLNNPTKVPKGYKWTELGTIPEDWKLVSLDEIGSFLKGRGIKRNDVTDEGLPCIRYGEIYTHYDNYVIKPVSFIPTNLANTALQLINGDLLFTCSGETAEDIGKCVAYLGNSVAYAGGDIIVLRSSGQNSLYLGHLLNCPFVAQQKARYGQGDAIVHINTRNLAMIKLPLPPLSEQNAIAAALSDVDALIEALEKLITKKRDIKLATMQQLLTGKTRLPGFSGEWEVKRLGDLADIDPENLPSNTHPDYVFNYISLEQVDTGRLVGYTEEKFSTAPSRARRVLRYGDILMSTVRPNLMSHFYYRQQIENAVCSTGFAVLRAKSEIADAGYLFAHLFCHIVNNQINKILSGSNYPAINSRDVELIEIPCPCNKEEQQAIATVLSDMDAEIEALEQRLEKTKQIKQGMMQQLLTGRVRLV